MRYIDADALLAKQKTLEIPDPNGGEYHIDIFNQSFGGWKTEQSIGKTVFLTREEAEKALGRSENGT